MTQYHDKWEKSRQNKVNNNTNNNRSNNSNNNNYSYNNNNGGSVQMQPQYSVPPTGYYTQPHPMQMQQPMYTPQCYPMQFQPYAPPINDFNNMSAFYMNTNAIYHAHQPQLYDHDNMNTNRDSMNSTAQHTDQQPT